MIRLRYAFLFRKSLDFEQVAMFGLILTESTEGYGMGMCYGDPYRTQSRGAGWSSAPRA